MNKTISPLRRKLTFELGTGLCVSITEGHDAAQERQMREWHQWRTGTGNVLRETTGISIASKCLTGDMRRLEITCLLLTLCNSRNKDYFQIDYMA
jgi:hypothetical protein